MFLAPGLFMFAVYVLIPIGQSLWLSFFDWDGLGARTWLGWENYVELWTDEAFWMSLRNNVIWLVLYMLAPPAGLMIAIFLNQNITGIRIYKGEAQVMTAGTPQILKEGREMQFGAGNVVAKFDAKATQLYLRIRTTQKLDVAVR